MTALPQKSHLARVGGIWFVFSSCDFVDRRCFYGERNDPRSYNQPNMKLVTT